MKILRLALINFQGVRGFTLDAKTGESVSVYADNATGKTTLYNAFLWLLFEKNSLGSKDFDIKTRDASGEVIPAIAHEVEAVLEIDGKEITLKRVFLEKYTKKRGSASQEFTGHVTEHFINGVPKSKGEYQDFIASIAPEKLFMALTNPTYFNEQLSWKERRKMLLGLCPEIKDEDILAGAQFADLRPILDGRSVEDAKKVEMATRKKINEELTGIPGRIDEANRAIPENASGNPESLATKAQHIAKGIESLREEKIRILSGGQVAAKQKELAAIDTAIIVLRNQHAALIPDVSGERKQMHDLANQMQVLGLRISADKQEIATLELSIVQAKADSRAIATRWTQKNAALFVPGGACPTCGQEYPENLLAAQEADFNRAKAQALESIVAEGQRNEAAWKEATAKLSEKQINITNNQLAIDDLQKQHLELQALIDRKCALPDVSELPEFIELSSQRQAIDAEIAKLQGETGPILAEIDERIAAKQAELDAANRTITAIETAAEQRRRIEELKAREKELAAQFERSEKMLFLIEQFIQAKVGLLEESINGRFERVRWKLFDTQINGGLQETCVCTVDGVPYPSINNGAKIQGGLDIIKSFSAHYGISAPVWVDNKESVTTLPKMPGQVISLVVSEADKALRVVCE